MEPKAAFPGHRLYPRLTRSYPTTLRKELTREELIGREGSYMLMLGAGVPSDHLSTPTRNTARGGKPWSWGYDCSDKYQ